MIDNFRGDYLFLSNFYEAPVIFDGIRYSNNEAAFQAQKCINVEDRKAFSTMSPSEAKKAGRKVILRLDWEAVKVEIMYKIVKAKFTQNIDLALKLAATNNEELIEGNTWGDKIWGKVNGEGQNLLGEILMDIRDSILNLGENCEVEQN